MLPAGSPAIRNRGSFDPRNLRVRVQWVGFGSTYAGRYPAAVSGQAAPGMVIPPSSRVLATFHLPGRQMRIRWLGLGFGALSLRSKLLLGLYVILLIVLVSMQPAKEKDPTLVMEKVSSGDLISDDINLGGETIKMIHSPLDIGQAKDAFDGDIQTLMRGRDANPFILDVEFPQPRAITGIMMDFGRMDFLIRVQVYGADSPKPLSYQGEYRQQPDIPHIDMNFDNGPKQVTRIYIEIEQINPPEEVHVHVRELIFKE